MIDDGRCTQMRERRLIEAAGVIDELGGAYITAEDIGTTTADMDLMVAAHRPTWSGARAERGGAGDPSPVTAETVFRAIRRGLAQATGSDELDGRRVGRDRARQGRLRAAPRCSPTPAPRWSPATSIPSAPSASPTSTAASVGARPPRPCSASELDVLAPCAAGGMIDDALARSTRLPGRGGAANNPLTSRDVARDARAPRDPLRARLPRQLRRADPRGRRVVRRATDPTRPDWWTAPMERLERAIATARGRGLDAARGRRAPGARAGRRAAARVSAGLPLAERPLYSRRFGARLRTGRDSPDLRGGRRADRREGQGRRPARGRPAAVRARAGGADARSAARRCARR